MKGGDGMRIGFIGAGKVGCTLGKYFRENGIPVSGYYNRTSEHAKEAAEFVNAMRPHTVVPTHYASIVGSLDDAREFVRHLDRGIEVCLKIE